MLQNAFAHGGQMWATIRQSPFMTEHLDCNVPAESRGSALVTNLPQQSRWGGGPILQAPLASCSGSAIPSSKIPTIARTQPQKICGKSTDCPEWSDRPRPKIPHSKSHCTSLPGKLRSCTFAVGISCSESLPKRMFSPQRADPSIRNSCRRRVPKVPKFTCRHKSLKGSKLS